jgi:pimeloyl-ACP methyl ester carboxylesterase
VADVRVEQRLEHERFVCESDGRLVWALTVRSEGRPSAGKPGAEDWFYTVEEGNLYRLPVGGSGISRSRYGGKSSTVIVGDHPLADQVRRLQLSSSWASEFVPDRQLWLTGPPEQLAAVGWKPPPAPAGQATRGQLVVSAKPGVEFEVDQGLDSLSWEPAAKFAGPRLGDRCKPTGGAQSAPGSGRARPRIGGPTMAERPTRGVFGNGMAYTRHGEGPTSLLFVPGGPGNTLPTGVFELMTRRMVRPYIDAGCTVWTVTRRQNMPAGHSIEDMAGDFARLIKEEYGGHIDIYLGISYGGLIGHYLAAVFPDTCGHFVFVGAGHSVSERGRQLDHRLAVELSRGRQSAAGAILVEDGLSRPGLTRFRWLARLLGPAVGRMAFGRAHPYFRSDVLVEAEAELAFDSREILPNIQVPVLLISGDRDDYARKDVLEETARLIPDGELRLYEGKTHEGAITDKRLPQDVLEFARGSNRHTATS